MSDIRPDLRWECVQVMTDLSQFLEPFYWLQSHEWVFWILVNLSAYFGYWIARYGMLGILGVILPFASGACTVIFASEWWMGSIGIATILAVCVPFFLIAWQDRKRVEH